MINDGYDEKKKFFRRLLRYFFMFINMYINCVYTVQRHATRKAQKSAIVVCKFHALSFSVREGTATTRTTIAARIQQHRQNNVHLFRYLCHRMNTLLTIRLFSANRMSFDFCYNLVFDSTMTPGHIWGIYTRTIAIGELSHEIECRAFLQFSNGSKEQSISAEKNISIRFLFVVHNFLVSSLRCRMNPMSNVAVCTLKHLEC